MLATGSTATAGMAEQESRKLIRNIVFSDVGNEKDRED